MPAFDYDAFDVDWFDERTQSAESWVARTEQPETWVDRTKSNEIWTTEYDY